MNLEPSWEVMGEIVSNAILESNVPNSRKAGLAKIVRQMAAIAHDARAYQLKQQFRDGEIKELPEWAE
jgi:hypothetical protein